MKHYQRKCLQIFLIVFCISIFALGTTGCANRDQIEIGVGKGENGDEIEPHSREDGKPYVIAVMDLVPPIESSYLWLKGLSEGLQSLGYISPDVDFSKAPEEFDGFYSFLLHSDLGDYVAFDDSYYLIGGDDDDAIKKTLKEKAENGEIQLVAASGTDPGLFLKELDLPIPFTVSLATDPIASGIIDSAENTGDEDIWALVEPNPYYRQFGAYHSMLSFDTIGLITVEEYDVIAGNSEYRTRAREEGVTIREVSVTEAESLSEDFGEILLSRIKTLDTDGMDAVLFAFGSVDDDTISDVSSYFAKKGIPTLIGDGDSLVQYGGMLSLSCFDYEGYGNYTANVIAHVFSGEKAGDQETTYISSPHIVINMTTAKETGFETTMDLMRACDVIWR